VDNKVQTLTRCMMTAAQDKLAVDDVVGSFLPREAADAGVGATLRRRSCAD